MKNQRYFTLVIFSVFVASLYVFFVSYIQEDKKNHIQFLESIIKKEAVTIFETISATRQWVANFEGVYVDKRYEEGFDDYVNQSNIYSVNHDLLVRVVPDTLTKEISKISKNSMKHTFSLTGMNPINPENKANKFEERAFKYFENNPKNNYFYERNEDFSEYKFVGALIANETCLNCHASKNVKLGDTLGGISIELNTEDYYEQYVEVIEEYNTHLFLMTLSVLIGFIIVIRLYLLFSRKTELLKTKNNELLLLKEDNENLIKRYKYAVEGSQSGIWDWNLLTDEVIFDKNWKGMLGYAEDELEDKLEEWDIRVHPDDKEKALKDILNNQHKKTDFYLNIHRLRHKQGHWVWILDRGKTYFDENDKPIRMVGFHTDISEFKELELKLYEKEQNLMTAQEIAQMGHWRYNSTADFFLVSDALYKLLGIPKLTKLSSYSDFKQLVHEDDQDEYMQKHKSIFQTKSKGSLQYRIKPLDSDEIIYINEQISIVYNEKAKEESYIGTMQDITALKKAEQELKLFKEIIDNSPISILMTDKDVKIIYVNKYFTQISGYDIKDVIGKNPKILKSNKTSPEEYKDMWKTLLSKNTWGGIFKNISKEGKEFWETALIIPIMDEQDEIVNYLGIKREITKEVYLEKELHEKEELMLVQSKNAAMGEMISMIAHQWRQPITTISMMANNILADIELEIFEEQTAKKFAMELSKQTQYLSKTIEDFRNFFKQDKTTEQSSLQEIFEDINSIILASLKNHSIELQVNYDNSIVIKTYIRELLQVLINLIKNAKEAFENQKIEHPYIHIDVKENGELLEIFVRDNAGGISPENINKVFEAYFTTKEEHNGTGLGLYMSKMIVQKHLKGDITVHNTNDGVEFKVSLQKFI